MSNQSLNMNSKLQIVFNLIIRRTLSTTTKRKKRVANKVSHGTPIVLVIIYTNGILASQRTSWFHSCNECHHAHRKQSSEVAMAFLAQTRSPPQLLVSHFPALWHFSSHI